MARVLGIDLGAYTVKVAVANPGFRVSTLDDFIERVVPGGDEPHEVRAARVLAEIIRERKLETENLYLAISGDHVFTHVVEFGFKNLRRADLEKAVGAELEGILPIDLEDMAFAFEALPDDLDAAGEPVLDLSDEARQVPDQSPGDDEPTFVQTTAGSSSRIAVRGRVAEPATGMRLLACATPTTWGKRLLEVLALHGIEPRGMLAMPGAYPRVVARVDSAAGVKDDRPVAIVDVGHERTDVCVVTHERAVFGRSISRGGKDVTAVIASAWRLDWADAESAKHSDGFIASSAEPAPSEAFQRISGVLVGELKPLARDLRQTLAACRAKTGATVARVILVGGGSRLRGLPGFLADQLGVPVSVLGPTEDEAIVNPALASAGLRGDVAALSAGIAMEGSSGRPRFDLRQGELAYQADMSFLRQKAAQLATAALVIIAFASLNAYMALYSLRKSETALDERLALETTAIEGAPMNAEDVLAKYGSGTEDGPTNDSPLPKMSAYDILLAINEKLPDKKEVTLDVSEIEIERGKISLKMTAASGAEIDKIQEQLDSIECINEITPGPRTSGENDTKSQSFTMKTECM